MPPKTTEPRIPNEVLGTLIFITTEIMLFAGLISAHLIAKASVPVWPPPGQPRLPIESTAVTTAALLLSGLVMVWAGRRYAESVESARRPMLASALLGALFVFFQGMEGVALVGEGLTMVSSPMGAFFYLIVGMHALHATAGLLVVAYQYRSLQRGTLTAGAFKAGRIFWYFVVLLWPVLYWQVYL